MTRLFIALDLPDPVKDALGTLSSGIPGAKWVKRDQMHLTLRFIGEADEARFAAIKAALASVQAEPFQIRLKGVGQFPAKGKPRVVWAGVQAPPILTQLQRQIETTLLRQGLAPEEKPFSAHITLARFKLPPPAEPTRAFFARHANFQTDTIPVEAFILYSSILAPQGATYRREGMYRLVANE